MAQQQSPQPVLHLTEGLYITASAPDRVPLKPLPGSGGGGPGFGGWGLDAGRPRGTGGPSRFVRDPGWRSVFGEEQNIVDRTHADLHATNLEQLTAQIEAERAAIRQQASDAATTAQQRVMLQQQLTTTRLLERRTGYLQLIPVATGFYGAIPFYKRYDSFSTRLNDDGAFVLGTSGPAWARNIWETYNASVDAAYRLHLAAEKNQALAADLQALARQVDQAELDAPSVNLPRVIERREAQIRTELQICFDCLPNFVQHQLVASTAIQAGDSLSQALLAYATATHTLVGIKEAAVPAFAKSNPNIRGPLSKPQVEALQHLVDEQSTRRAGPLWAAYHSALSLKESIRYLQWFKGVLSDLQQRTVEIEGLKGQQQETETERNRARYTASAKTATVLPTVIPVGAASFAIAHASYTALQLAIRAAILLRIASATPLLPTLVGTAALLWPSTLGNAERRYLTSIPLADLSPPDGPDLAGMAASAQALDLPYMLAGVEEEERLDLYVVPGDKPVPVRAATFDSARQVYSLALDNPQRVLTWTPASAPGNEEGSATRLPSVPSGTIIYSGSSLDPVSNELEGYPAPDLLDQERLIVTFPIDSGLPPILVVFKSRRYETGTSIGKGAPATETWRNEAASPGGSPIPAQIADRLRGIEFKNFDAFRRQFWKAVANDPELSKQFSSQDLRRMKKHGYSPWVEKSNTHMKKRTYEIHHVIPISEQGGVYDMDNLTVVTPKIHHQIHYEQK